MPTVSYKPVLSIDIDLNGNDDGVSSEASYSNKKIRCLYPNVLRHAVLASVAVILWLTTARVAKTGTIDRETAISMLSDFLPGVPSNPN